jgi:hypothetical protein
MGRISYRRKHKKNKSGVKKAPPVSYKTAKDITKHREPEVKLDSKGNVVYSSQYIGDEKFEYWVEYNLSGNPLYYHDSRGMWWKCKYNSNGNIAYYWDYSGYEETYNYYKGNVVICITSYGNKIKHIIDRSKYIITRDLFMSLNVYN